MLPLLLPLAVFRTFTVPMIKDKTYYSVQDTGRPPSWTLQKMPWFSQNDSLHISANLRGKYLEQ